MFRGRRALQSGLEGDQRDQSGIARVRGVGWVSGRGNLGVPVLSLGMYFVWNISDLSTGTYTTQVGLSNHVETPGARGEGVREEDCNAVCRACT